ncbi:MAG: hypothetical protein R3B93_18960 [Bacteroidia bacterium]
MRSLLKNKTGILLSFLFLSPAFIFAQTAVEGALTTVRDLVVGAANIIFVILIVGGIIRTVAAFIGGNPNAVRYLIYLALAVLIWFGFSLLVADFDAIGGIENL